ncbi:MAG TPA: hypothetical protein VHE81_06550 [Lacipirellulaceae bacterium]|nr:hypothetical protein [Lacipirellulaceae bacterium]
MATTPILNLPVAIGVDNSYWVPTASTNGSPTERVNVVTLSGLQGNLDQITKVQGSVLYRGALQWDSLGPGTAGYVLSTQGPDANPTWVPNTAGSVTSVGLALPGSLFSVSGSPVTSSGTLTGDLIVQSANQVFAGPATGSDAVPTFRSLVNADILGGGVALTKTDDTNVTLTLGGDASTSLVNAASLTLGWKGQLSVPRGGTGRATLDAHGVLVGAGTSGVNVTGTGSSGQILTSNGTSADPTFQDGAAVLGKALTTADDTNITLTLGGSSTTALLAASSITAGWTGLLGLERGGTNADLSATGGTSQVLRQSSTGAAITVSQLSASDIASGQALTRTNDTNVTLTLGGTPAASLLAATSLTLGWTGTLSVARGGIGVGTLASHGVLLGQGTSAVTATSVGADGSILAGNTGADPTFKTLASVLDFISSTQGTILYRGASAWSALAPGASGEVLSSGGPAADPVWTAVEGTGTVTSVDVSGGTTGLTTSGGPITTSGTITIDGTLLPSNGGTGLTSGTSGGILGFTASGTVASSVALTANALVRGGGAGSTPVPSAVSEDGSGNLTGVTTINGSSPHARLRTINPMGQYSQAGLASTSNGNYTGFDQWYALTQSNPITPSQLTLVEDGTPYMMRFTQDNASAQRYGVAQPFEFSFVNDLRGKAVSLSARVRMSAATTLRYAIVEWTGTADSLTKNIVNNWSSSTYTPGNFFISSNTTITATGSTALASNTLTTITLSGTVSSSMNNLIIFFWTDSTQAQTTTLDIGNVFFGAGTTAPAIFEPPAPDADFLACCRYYYYLQNNVTDPYGFGYTQGSTSGRIKIPVPALFRTLPTVTTALASTTYQVAGSNITPSALSVRAVYSGIVYVDLTITGGVGSNPGVWIGAQTIQFDARL